MVVEVTEGVNSAVVVVYEDAISSCFFVPFEVAVNRDLGMKIISVTRFDSKGTRGIREVLEPLFITSRRVAHANHFTD